VHAQWQPAARIADAFLYGKPAVGGETLQSRDGSGRLRASILTASKSNFGGRRALILGRSNGVGLDRDAALLAEALGQLSLAVRTPQLRSLRALFAGENRADAAIHLERVFPRWKWKAKTHFLIPNQERYPLRHLGRLRWVDHVLCKSRHAEEIFSRHHASVHFIGFTSEDRLTGELEPDYSRFFHLAGKSTLKNTEALLELWRKHPEWPLLTLVQHPDNAPAQVPENVDLISRYVPDDELQALQNHCGIHLCPSLSEGWGHYIAEAMSCRAVTLVTDASPMNELVDASRGVVVAYDRSEPRHLGMNFHADPLALERAIQGLISMPETEKRLLGEEARRWFEGNDRAFRERVASVIGSLL
jgi:glycosyltransferase involved in cell wall biosynthesis